MADRRVFLYAAVYDNIPDAESDYDAVSIFTQRRPSGLSTPR